MSNIATISDRLAAKYAGGKTLEQIKQSEREYLEKHGRKPMSENEIAYWNKVYSTEKSINMPSVRRFRQEMDLEQAKREIRSHLALRAEQLRELRGPSFKLHFSAEQKEVINTLTQYFINIPTCPIPLQKSIWLYGQTGVFKTELMQIYSAWTTARKLSKAFQITAWPSMYDMYANDRDYDPITIETQFDRCFDDFLTRTGTSMKMGNVVDLTDAIIGIRADRHTRYGQLTHTTSNHQPNGAKDLVHPRIFDRFHDMFTSVHMPGTSRRGQNPTQ